MMLVLELLVLVALATSQGGGSGSGASVLSLQPAPATSGSAGDEGGEQQLLQMETPAAPSPEAAEQLDRAAAAETTAETPAPEAPTPQAQATGESGEEPATAEPAPTQEAAASVAAATAVDDAAARLLQLINAERASRGLAELTLNAALTRAGSEQCLYVATNQITGPDVHLGPDGANHIQRAQAQGYASIYVVENIAWGHATPEAVVAAWLNSPSHRQNLLDSNLRDAGVAHCTVSEGDYRDWWVFNAGAP